MPGGFEVMSYNTREIPEIFSILLNILKATCYQIWYFTNRKNILHCIQYSHQFYTGRNINFTSSDISFPGIAAMPVIKSLEINGLITIDLLVDGAFAAELRSKWIGINTTGTWLILFIQSKQQNLLSVNTSKNVTKQYFIEWIRH